MDGGCAITHSPNRDERSEEAMPSGNFSSPTSSASRIKYLKIKNMQQNKKIFNNKKILITTVIVFVVIILGLASYFIYSKIQKTEVINNPSLEFKNLFIATSEGNVLDIAIFDPVKNEVILSKKFPFDDHLSMFTKSAGWGANNAIQYDPKTQEIFYSTQGRSEYDGSCINKDGTCKSRIYKIGLNQEKPNVIFESDILPTNWIVDSSDNSLLLSFFESDKQTLKKIRRENGKEIFTKEYQIKEHTNLADFVLSNDGKFTYQASKESAEGKWFHEILRLRKIDNANGNVSEQEIFGGEAIEYETDLSPDNDYLAFYSGISESAKLYIYQISSKKLINVPYQGSIGNYNLLWSGDNKKLLYLLQNPDLTNNNVITTYYDLTTSRSIPASGDIQKVRYVYSWAPSNNYVVYKSVDGTAKIFDITKNQAINTLLDADLEMVAINWY